MVGSHEFYLGYAVGRTTCCSAWTAGTFIPPRSSRTSSRRCCSIVDEILLHVSRGVRWDSDHVVTLTDELQAIVQEIVRGDYLDRVHIGLDFFDASINRVAAWVIGTRNALRALLLALLEPIEHDARAGAWRRLHRAAGAAGRAQGHALWRGLGLSTACSRMCRLASASWTRSRPTRSRN